MAEANVMTGEDVKKTDGDKSTETVMHQTTNPERAPNVPVDAPMASSSKNDSVVPGTAAKATVPTISKGADTSSSDTLRKSEREQRERDNAAQRAKWQDENVAEPVKAVADQKGKF